MTSIKFSIVIPMYNEAGRIEKCIGSIRDAIGDRDDTEMLVIDNGSTDGCDKTAEAMGAKVIRHHRETISHLRNSGGRQAQGDYILFIDSDIEVPNNWLSEIEKQFAALQADVMAFLDLAPESAPWFAKRWAERCLNRRDGIHKVDYLPGRNIYLKKSYFDEANGFDETLVTGEDKDFVMRLGALGAQIYSVYPPQLIHWGYEKTFNEWVRKEYWRQHEHPNLLIRHNFSLRVIRFPLLALAHAVLLIMALLKIKLCIPLLLLSLLPSLAITLKHPHSRQSPLLIGQFTLLYWLRFQIAAYSIIRASFEKIIGSKK